MYSKDWAVEILPNDHHYEIIITGVVKVEMTIINVELCKIYPVNFDPRILNLEVVNAGKSTRGILQNVTYAERIDNKRFYHTVRIFHDEKPILVLPI